MYMYIVLAPFGVLVSVTFLALLSSLSHSRTFLYRHILNSFLCHFPASLPSDIPVLVELRLVWSFQGGFTLIVFWLLCEYFISVLCADTEKELGKSFKICGHANAASCDVNFVVISLFLRLLFGVWGLKTVNAAEFFLMTFEPV